MITGRAIGRKEVVEMAGGGDFAKMGRREARDGGGRRARRAVKWIIE